jgi:hypothetical protein
MLSNPSISICPLPKPTQEQWLLIPLPLQGEPYVCSGVGFDMGYRKWVLHPTPYLGVREFHQAVVAAILKPLGFASFTWNNQKLFGPLLGPTGTSQTLLGQASDSKAQIFSVYATSPLWTISDGYQPPSGFIHGPDAK